VPTRGSSQLTPPLQAGDAVAVVAASSAIDDASRLQEGLELLSSWGLQPLPWDASKRRWGYLAGTDDQRRTDLNPSPTAPLLACARGGWGAARLLEEPIRWQPGWLLGFSDVTALLWARLAAGIDGGIHGPLLTTLAGEPLWSQQRLQDLLFGRALPDLRGETWSAASVSTGAVRGPLVAANLTVATHLLGSPHVPALQGAILVLEDVAEAPYRLDRMLTQWRLLGLLQKLGGLCFGRFSDCNDQDPERGGFSLEQVLRERCSDLGIPVLSGLPVGHGPGGNAALPMGRLAELDPAQGCLRLL
jgi:muramoyltetrapeptide carboxypeptidase